MDEATGRISEAQLRRDGEDKKRSYCDLLGHLALKEEHEVLVPSTEMAVDTRRFVASCTFPAAVECSGDIRVVVKTITLTSERNAFVWFNSQFVTDRLTVFNEFEMDRSKSSSFSSMDSSSSFSSMDSSSSSTTQDSDGVAVSMDSSSFNLFSSTAAPTPLPEEAERELFLRCVFDDDALLETEELARWRAEKAGAEQGGEVAASDRVLPMKPISLIQKASTQIITSTRNLISRVSSTSSGLLRTASASSSRHTSAPSSPTHSLHGLQGLQGLQGASEEREAELVEMPETASAVQLRTKAEIERRTTMRMKSLHESEEITMSSSTPTGNSQKTEDKTPLRSVEESSDEIPLSSDEGESRSLS